MTNEHILIAILCFLVVILSFLLFQRIRKGKARLAVLEQSSSEDFSELLKLNSREGTIQGVARKVSDLLRDGLQCDAIIFLRKRRNSLELNYYHGIKRFNRQDFRVGYSPGLFDLLRADFKPRSTALLKEYLPQRFIENLENFGINLFFPILWRENLYGVYFVRSGSETSSTAFNLLTASLAQSLSTAYHIKWHESRQETLKLSMTRERNNSGKIGTAAPMPGSSILKLVGHKNVETIIPKLIGAIKDDLGLERLALAYSDKGANGEIAIRHLGFKDKVSAPDEVVFTDLLRQLDRKDSIGVGEIEAHQVETKNWIESLRNTGLENVSAFSLSSDKPGLLAWSGKMPLGQTNSQLKALRPHIVELIDSVSSYQAVEQLSFTDNLTGLANQRYFNRRLAEEISRAKRYNRKLALILFDLDQLKAINDTFGHLSGDAVLKQMGEILRYSIRSIDIIARYGGDEFCIIMPEADAEVCTRFMDRLRSEVSSAQIDLGDGQKMPSQCTISLGGAVYPDHAEEARELFDCADMALLKAKEEGRNMGHIHQ